MNEASNANEITQLQEALIRKLIHAGCIRSPSVEAAFRNVQRHVFLPGVALERAYSDEAIPTKRLDGKAVSSSSQPAIMAIMLEQLQLQPGHRILEIGAGTGYNAGLMRSLVGNTGAVVTVDIDQDIVDSARDHLKAAGIDGVKVICGDGGLGYAASAPYDRVVLTVGAWDIVPAWWTQLKPDGRMVLPLDIKDGIQKSVAFDRMDSRLESVSVVDCEFMTLRGAFARPRNTVSLGAEPGVSILADRGVEVDGKAVYRMLSGPAEDVPTGIYAKPAEVIFGGLSLYLSLRVTGLCTLLAEGQAVDRGMVPRFMAMSGEWEMCWTLGQLGDDALCLFVGPPGYDAPSDQVDTKPAELFVRSYGDGVGLAAELVELTRAWDAAGRPSSKGLHVRAYPKDTSFVPSADQFVINKDWSQLVLGWA